MDKLPSRVTSFLSLIAFGAIFLSVGVFIALISLDIIPVPEENIHAPRWVITAAGLTFGVAGLLVVVNGLKEIVGTDSAILRWLTNSLALVFMLALAVPFNWVGFWPGERQFSRTVGIGPFTFSSDGGEIGGRIAFGLFAILMDVFILLILGGLITGKGLGDE